MGSLEVKALAPSYPPGKKNNKSNGERSDDAVEPPPAEYIINPRDRIGSSGYLDLGRVVCLVRCERKGGRGGWLSEYQLIRTRAESLTQSG